MPSPDPTRRRSSRRTRSGPVPPQVDAPVLGTLEPARATDLVDGAALLDKELAGLDLTSASFRRASLEGCELTDLRLTDADLTGLRLLECRCAGWDAPALQAARSSWRDVLLERSRLGAVEWYEAEFRSVMITTSKLGYLNLRGADLQDVVIDGCSIEELDLTGATVRRLVVRDSAVGTVTASGSTLTDVDLRKAELSVVTDVAGLKGAWFDAQQLLLLAPLLADHLGLHVG